VKSINNGDKAKEVKHHNVKSGNEKQKIIVLGDSYAKGLAGELKHMLNEEYKILGLVKPGSTLANMVNTLCSDVKALK
jgi:hypothetical protein